MCLGVAKAKLLQPINVSSVDEIGKLIEEQDEEVKTSQG